MVLVIVTVVLVTVVMVIAVVVHALVMVVVVPVMAVVVVEALVVAASTAVGGYMYCSSLGGARASAPGYILYTAAGDYTCCYWGYIFCSSWATCAAATHKCQCS